MCYSEIGMKKTMFLCEHCYIILFSWHLCDTEIMTCADSDDEIVESLETLHTHKPPFLPIKNQLSPLTESSECLETLNVDPINFDARATWTQPTLYHNSYYSRPLVKMYFQMMSSLIFR